jgi:hypothetical protein
MAQSETTSQPSGPANAPAAPGSQPTPPAIDIVQLAERVYRLMREDLRLERARGQSLERRKAR